MDKSKQKLQTFYEIFKGPGKTTYAFSVTFRLACYQQAGRVWSGGKGTENMLVLAENVYVVLPTPNCQVTSAKFSKNLSVFYRRKKNHENSIRFLWECI
jgi:hypothetical protein